MTRLDVLTVLLIIVALPLGASKMSYDQSIPFWLRSIINIIAVSFVATLMYGLVVMFGAKP